MLTLSLLVIRLQKTAALLPLLMLFCCIALMLIEPIAANFFPSMRIASLVIMLPALLCLGPLMWLYVDALTSESMWRPKLKYGSHFILAGLGLACALLTLALPTHTQHSLFFDQGDVDSGYVGALMILAFALIIGWTVQSGIYLGKIIHKLLWYRTRLKTLFSNNDKRELNWIMAFILFLGGIWIISISGLLAENLLGWTIINRLNGAVIALLLVWVLSLWGTGQTPGFEGRYDEALIQDATPHDKKYQRSALGSEQSQRIAIKIEKAMSSDKIFLDPNLSLARLSEQLGISPNYVSQTLNETLGLNFFDYVNRWRIESAKEHLKNGSKTILEITNEVGFNARSSFYKAFKLHAGVTPSEFRKSC